MVNTEDKVDHDFDIVILATPMTNDTEAMHLEGTKPINTGGQYHRYFLHFSSLYAII